MNFEDKYFSKDQKQVTDIEAVLMDNEQVIFKTTPNKKSYIAASILKMLPIALIWLCFDATFIYLLLKFAVSDDGFPKALLFVIVPFFVLHLAPVWVWIMNIVKSVLELKNIEYAVTDKRIIIKSGVIGIDFKSINYSEIDCVNVKVGLIDKICKVGDIYINSHKNTAVLFDVENAYSVGKNIEQISIDIKSDMQYPNELRPKENSGYQPSYKGNAFKE